ncbi:protein kinase, partial [Pseudomonas sp. KB_15]
VRTCGEQLQRAFDAAHRVGDVPSGAFTRNNLVSNLLFAGEPLPALQDEAERGVAYARQVRFGIAIGFSENQLALIRMLRGITPTFGYLDGEHFSESLVEPGLSLASPVFACWYWIRKLQARYFAGDLAAAMDAAAHAKALLWSSYSFLEEAEYYFYGALARAGLCDALPAGDQQSHLDILADHHRELQ